MPTYNDTPLAGESKSYSQPLIRENFTSIETAWNVNHVAIDDATDYGKHNHISLPEQGAAPSTAANEAAIYARVGALSSVTELCFRRESDGSIIEFTGGTLAEPGWTRLPSGLLIKWGITSATGYTTITFPVAGTIPAFTSIFTVSANVYGAAAGNTDTDCAVRVDSFTTTNFIVYTSARSTTGAKLTSFAYLAIGA